MNWERSMRRHAAVNARIASLLFSATSLLALNAWAAEPASQTPLDLRAPDISSVFTQEQIDRVLANTRDPDTIEEVEVEGARLIQPPPTTPTIRSPLVGPGLFAPFWALANPTQAWRIFAPLPPDQSYFVGNDVPDATDSYRPMSIDLLR